MRLQFASRLFCLAASLLATAACTGQVLDENGARSGDANGASSSAGSPSVAGSSATGGVGADPQKEPSPEECEAEKPLVAPSLVRRLTRAEYDQTLRDLLGEERRLADSFTPENRNNGFDNQAASQNVQRDDILLWEAAAKDAASRAVRANVLECDAAADDANACFERAIPRLAARLFRHSLDDAQAARYLDLFKERRTAGASSSRAAELCVTAMLLSPHFLYLLEPALDGRTRALDSYEIATRLSYLFTKSAPDAELWQAAEAGQLEDAALVRAQAERLVAARGAERAVGDFYFQWADGPGIDALVVPDGFDESLRQAAQSELASLVQSWIGAESSLIPALFTSRAASVTEPLARYYGLPAGTVGEVELPLAERSGLLTRAVFVGAHSLPPTRGDFVLNRVLCRPVPPPPVVPPDPMELGEFNTRREMFEAHAQLACAKGCHAILDPVGFAFEHYDGSGRFRTRDNGSPVNAATNLAVPGADDLTGPVDGAIELSSKIAASRALLPCQAEQWFRYAYSRLASPIDKCSVDALSRRLVLSSGDVRQLMVELTQTDAFRFVRKEAL